MDDRLPTRYELDAYGFRVAVETEMETMKERQSRQRRGAKPTVKFTGLKYDEDAGWYAVRNGRIVCPADGISGMKADAEHALAWASIDWFAVEPLPVEEQWANEPGYMSIPF